MRILILLSVTLLTLESCTKETPFEEPELIVCEELSAFHLSLGEWQLESRLTNNVSDLSMLYERLIFREDLNTTDENGVATYLNVDTTQMSYAFDSTTDNFIFYKDDGDTIVRTVSFMSHNGMELQYTKDSDQIVELWRKQD